MWFLSAWKGDLFRNILIVKTRSISKRGTIKIPITIAGPENNLKSVVKCSLISIIFIASIDSIKPSSIEPVSPIKIFEGVILNQTIAKYYLPSGHTPQINGIKPDFEVFASPNPTDKDKLGIREKDLYAFLPNGGEEFKQEPEIIHTLNERQKCAEKTGFARLIYNSSTDLIKPDFQLLYAQDISNCFLDFFKKNKK